MRQQQMGAAAAMELKVEMCGWCTAVYECEQALGRCCGNAATPALHHTPNSRHTHLDSPETRPIDFASAKDGSFAVAELVSAFLESSTMHLGIAQCLPFCLLDAPPRVLAPACLTSPHPTRRPHLV